VVHKFGGSSLADAAAVRQAAALVVEERDSSCFVVVSAARGVTDELLACVRAAASGEDWRRGLSRLKRRQNTLIRALLCEEAGQSLREALAADSQRLKALLTAVAVLRNASPETVDAVLAHGELWSMRLFAAMLRERGLAVDTLDARNFLALRRADEAVAVDWSQSSELFADAMESLDADIVVVPGFIGRCAERGIALTLGRNGSDWSATILARLAGAGTVTIWSDVRGVLDGDPEVVGEATTQREIDFDTAHTLSSHGARILHPATLAPLAESDVSVYVKSTFAPREAATRLDRDLAAPEAMVSAHGGTVSLIGKGVRATAALDALAHARVPFESGEITRGRLSVQVAPEDVERSQRIWHRSLCRRRPRVDVVLIGVGHVGGAFLKALGERTDEAVRLVGVADSKRFARAENGSTPRGLSPKQARRLLHATQAASNPDAFAEFLLAHCEAAPVIVDATGSAEIAARHAAWLEAGIHVVTANKIAAAGGWITPRCREAALYGDAATVGAGLPVLVALRRLRDAGDEVVSVEGMLSGSLAYLFHALERGRRLGAALVSAERAGYVEPDPRADLSGTDVARKLAILADAAGIEVAVATPEPAVPAELLGEDEATFRHRLPEAEAALRQRVCEARAKRQVLRYVASLSADGANRIGPCVVARKATLAQTRGVDNIAVIRSRAYAKEPLVIRGPGAGPLVTARAMLADLGAITNRYG
jgi:aspartokinase/homoserine dehydrogenase 1